MRRVCLAFLLLMTCVTSFAWSGDGHRYVAQIAYDNLTPQAKRAVDKLTFPEGEKFQGHSRFIYISNWADRIKSHDKRFNQWHFIDLPLSVHNAPTQPMNKKNAVFAIEKAKKTLAARYATNKNKLRSLKFLVHIVGDIHQPLHTVNRYTWRKPRGDFGGNSFYIFRPDNKKVSLHFYWDRGLGLFGYYNRAYPVHRIKIIKVAKALEWKFRGLRNNTELIERPTIAWANEGRYLSGHVVYNTKEGAVPDKQYIAQGKELVQERIALAGFRLANILNKLYS